MVFWILGAFILGAVIGHRFLPPRIDEERERVLNARRDAMWRAARARKPEGE